MYPLIRLFQNIFVALLITGVVVTIPGQVIGSETTESSGSTGALVGPQGVVGPIEPVGPQGPTGPQGATGVQAVSSASSTSGEQTTSSVSSDNTNTGPDSQNNTTVTSDTSASLDLDNDTTINHGVTVEANSGDNKIKDNTKVEDISTGDVTGSVTVVNTANSQLGDGSSVASKATDQSSGTLVINPLASQRINLNNNETGPDSENNNTVTSTSLLEGDIANTSVINNDVQVEANTGRNTLARNTQTGNLTTGDINLGLNILNLANLQLPDTDLIIDSWAILSDFNGDLVLPSFRNENTGPDSLNTNTHNSNNDTDISITQNADINSDIDIATTTGENRLVNNTEVGNVTTGNTDVSVTETTIANIVAPVLYIINVIGKWTGELLGLNPDNVIVNEISNENTGPDSENTNNSTDSTTIRADINNDARVTNRLGVNANTGKNIIDSNSKVGDIETGAIKVGANVVNIVNAWGTGLKKAMLGVITIFGDWTGNAKSEDYQPSPIAVATTKPEEVVSTTPSVGGATEPFVSLSSETSDTIMANSSSDTLPTQVNDTHAEEAVSHLFVPVERIEAGRLASSREPKTAPSTTQSKSTSSPAPRIAQRIMPSKPKVKSEVMQSETVSTEAESKSAFPFSLPLGILLAWGGVELIARRRSK